MKVENVRIYDLEESMIAAGYPMRTIVPDMDNTEISDKDLARCQKLSKATVTQGGNQAHDQFLTGIRVSFDLTFSNKAWVEAERYRFLEFVSSQSTMHRITKFDLRNQYNEYVDPRIIEIMVDKVNEYNAWVDEPDIIMNDYGYTQEEYAEQLKMKYLEILYSNPAGFQLTARITTNYRCLKNIYRQRKDHRLPEWQKLCSWIETLPYARELILCED